MIINKRFLFVTTMMIYIVLYNILYLKMVCPALGYYPNTSGGIFSWILFGGLSLFPAFWLPLRVNKPSGLFFLIFYIIAFVPVCYLSMYSLLLDKANFFIKVFTAGISFFSVYVVVRFLKIPRIKLARISPGLLWVGLLFFAIFGLGILVVRYRDIMHFVGFSNLLYEQRAIYTALNPSRNIYGYLFAFLNSVIFPFFIIYGLYVKPRQWVLIFLGIIGQICLYCIAANRITILSIFFIPALMLFFLYT